MANAPDANDCQASGRQGDAYLAIDPWRSLKPHFGMLVGVDDFKTIDAYHRGKMWLHTAWLHREGVVWGFGASLESGQAELRIEPGLGIDRAGRELHLERAACIDLEKWFLTVVDDLEGETGPDEPDEPEPDEPGEEEEPLPDGWISVEAHVRARFVGCLNRQVPAMVEPCDGAGRTTAYSRVFETIELELVLGPPEYPPPPYHRLRLMYGVDAPELGEDDEPVPADAEVLEALAYIAGLPFAERPMAFETAFRRFAALDGAELAPAESDDQGGGGASGLLPAVDPTWLVIAELHDVQFSPDPETAGAWNLEDVTIDITKRLTHVATRSMQDLVAASLNGATAPGTDAARVIRSSFQFDGTDVVRFETTSELNEESTTAATEAELWDSTNSVWVAWPIDAGSSSVTGTQVEITLVPPNPPVAGDILRFRIRGAGGSPALNTDGWPLAGATDEPSPPLHHGRDFVHMQPIGS